LLRRCCISIPSIICALVCAAPAQAQSRGVYPLGMSAIGSGVTAASGFAYANQLLYYARDSSKDNEGDTVATGYNGVLMDMNSFIWVSRREVLGGARFSMTATLPVAKNELTSDIRGNIGGGGGFADSYYLPLILGWNKERAAIRVLYGFLAPTGQFHAGATDNVGSGYWTSAFSSGQTFYLTGSRTLTLSLFEMYEVHTTQKETDIKPGDTINLDYSVMHTMYDAPGSWRLDVGLVGYEQRQTTARTGPGITEAQSLDRYAVNAAGAAVSASFPSKELSVSARFFEEFGNRSSYQGFSLQIAGSIGF